MTNCNLFVTAIKDTYGKVLVKIENKNCFVINNISATVSCGDILHKTHINSIGAAQKLDIGDETTRHSAFNAIGFYEGAEMKIKPELFNEKTGIYSGKIHHALVWPDNDGNNSQNQKLEYNFPEINLTVTLEFIAQGPRVAFIGHSFTGLWDSSYYYFKELAKMRGWNAQIAYSYWGGTGLAHYAGLIDGCEERADQCDKVLNSNDYYDFCIFAGNSDEAVSTFSGSVGAQDFSQRKQMLEGAKILNKKALQNSAETILWVPQAYRFGFFKDMGVKPWREGKPGEQYKQNNESYTLTLSNKQMTELNMNWYSKMAEELVDCRIAPVAEAYRIIIENYINDVDPFVPFGEECGDFGHQNNLGNYIAACVLYSLIFGESPEGLGIPTSHTFGMGGGKIAPHQARIIQEVAWQVTKKYCE